MSLPSLRGSSADASDPIETASLDELRALQLARLKQALAHAATIPHYRKKFSAAGVAPGDLKNLDGLKSFPFTNKDDLRQNYPFGIYILEVTRPGQLYELEVIVETRAVVAPEAARGLADRAVHLIKTHVGLTASVRAVAPGSVERSQGKAKRVIDKRPRL